MNEKLQAFARSELKKGLAQLSESQQLLFKRMYSHKNLDRPIDAVVDKLPVGKLDWAMQQIDRSVSKLSN